MRYDNAVRPMVMHHHRGMCRNYPDVYVYYPLTSLYVTVLLCGEAHYRRRRVLKALGNLPRLHLSCDCGCGNRMYKYMMYMTNTYGWVETVARFTLTGRTHLKLRYY